MQKGKTTCKGHSSRVQAWTHHGQARSDISKTRASNHLCKGRPIVSCEYPYALSSQRAQLLNLTQLPGFVKQTIKTTDVQLGVHQFCTCTKCTKQNKQEDCICFPRMLNRKIQSGCCADTCRHLAKF